MEEQNSEVIQITIAEKIRTISRDQAQLTPLDSLCPLFDGSEPDHIETFITEMLKDENYKDINTISVPTGALYLYSETYITRNYAKILSLAEGNDPLKIIVKTVREESNMYPRPTNFDFFKEPIFKIDPDNLETYISQVLKEEIFDDIKFIQASTGARYLYSSLHMNEKHARSLAEWNELKDYENP